MACLKTRHSIRQSRKRIFTNIIWETFFNNSQLPLSHQTNPSNYFIAWCLSICWRVDDMIRWIWYASVFSLFLCHFYIHADMQLSWRAATRMLTSVNMLTTDRLFNYLVSNNKLISENMYRNIDWKKKI